jgi:hypothetical protein
VWQAETVAFPPPDEAPAPQPPISVASPRVQNTMSHRSPAAESAPIVLFPLVAINRAFDVAALALGPPGEWLCTRAGRTALGFLGVTLLIGSAAWGAAGWFGWPR